MTTRLAKALAVAAFILFLISGVDVATNAPGGGDLLPLSSMVRGMIFGFGAVALATAAFFVSVKRESSLVSILLIVTGTLMVIAGVVSTRGLTLIWFPGPIIFPFSRILDNCAGNSEECENKTSENNISQELGRIDSRRPKGLFAIKARKTHVK